MFEEQEPVVTQKGGAMDGEEHTHPAYAQISAHRISGNATLYGSEFKHQHYVEVRITKSKLQRHLSNDWNFDGSPYIEVAMSEAQWASFVSSMNVGGGPCCTLRSFNGKLVPQLPEPKVSTEQFRSEIARVHAQVQAELGEIATHLDDAVGKKKAAELKRRIELAAHRIVGSAGFVADQFDEHIETTTEKAKIEVNAFVEAAVRRVGLQAIEGGSILQLPGPK